MDFVSEKGFEVIRKILSLMENGYLKLDSKRGYMPLVVENVDCYTTSSGNEFQIISFAHYGNCEGDLMADPEMLFWICKEKGIAFATYYKNDWAGVEQYSVIVDDGKLRWNQQLQKSHAEFAELWLNNINEQQF